MQDIRDRSYIEHKDICGLNFINSSGQFYFRRHYRQGLRSHVIEVLKKSDVDREKIGYEIDGILFFPKARPQIILRIFRTHFTCLQHALDEIRKVKVVERCLSNDQVATSTEIIIDYHHINYTEPILIGLQEYIHGTVLDPWSQLSGEPLLKELYKLTRQLDSRDVSEFEVWKTQLIKSTSSFIRKICQMIYDFSLLPDLAGIGNLLVTPEGGIKLVDINNISHVHFDDTIRLDDKGYPVSDKSLESLLLIENKILGTNIIKHEARLEKFFDLTRKKHVDSFERLFTRLKSSQN